MSHERGVEVAAQLLWTDPDRIHVLGIVPSCVLAVDPRIGLVETLSTPGPGPFDLEGPIQSMSAGARPGEILVHKVGGLRSFVLSPWAEPVQLLHPVVVTGCVTDGDGAWWMGPRLRETHAGEPARVDIWRGPVPGKGDLGPPKRPAWTGVSEGSNRDRAIAEYFTRLLRAPDGRLWRVILGEAPRIDLVDPLNGTSSELQIADTEGALIAASVDASGTLHLLTAGGDGSFGRRILRFDPDPLRVLEGDRDWNNGAVDPTGSRWVAAEADLGDLLVYELPATTDPNSP